MIIAPPSKLGAVQLKIAEPTPDGVRVRFVGALARPDGVAVTVAAAPVPNVLLAVTRKMTAFPLMRSVAVALYEVGETFVTVCNTV